MRRQRVRLAALTLLLAAGCGPDRAPGVELGTGGVDSAGAAGALTGGRDGSGGATAGGTAGGAVPGGAAGAVTGGGGTGGGVLAVCRNGLAEPGEQCDGADLAGQSCASVGFEVGALACSEDCTLVLDDCSGEERCTDGRDNDGDQRVDCVDPDCEEACADPCVAPPLLSDPATVSGSTVGHSRSLDSLCRWSGQESGPDLVYRVTAAHTGLLRVELESSAELSVGLRSDCDGADSELRCALGGLPVELPVTAGDELFVHVDGVAAAAAGSFRLTVASRELVCGDGFRDGDEGCDDGGTEDGDGCSADCQVESSEGSDNDRLESADPMAADYYGAIDPLGDEDWVSLEVIDPLTSLVVRTFDFGDNACMLSRLDNVLELYAADGSLLASDDDGGTGYCARLLVPGLAPGLYYLRTAASPWGTVGIFPYRLQILLDPCGNGYVSEAEQCDDGNLLPDDGCGPSCSFE